MKASDLSIFIVCLGIGLLFANFMGIGGPEFEGMGFFGEIENARWGIIVGLVGGIGGAAVVSFLSPKSVIGVVTALYAGFIGILIALSAGFFYSLPYGIGAIAGTAYLVFATIILFLDISEKAMVSG